MRSFFTLNQLNFLYDITMYYANTSNKIYSSNKVSILLMTLESMIRLKKSEIETLKKEYIKLQSTIDKMEGKNNE